jgi:DNA-directed RNA polymerase subunit RPC12/RpoP
MPEQKPTTGKYSQKRYRCCDCGHEREVGTNHWGEIYGKCPACGWKQPMRMGGRHECLEPVPEGMGVPEPWIEVKLGDVCEIVRGQALRRTQR